MPETAQTLSDLIAAGPPRARLTARSTAGALAAVSAATIAAFALRGVFPPGSMTLVHLVAVLFSAVVFGFWPGLISAGLAFLAYNFFFVEPLYTLRVTHAEDVLALVVFLLVAGLTGFLVGRIREEADAAKSRARLLLHLSHLSVRLGAVSRPDEVEHAIVAHLDGISGAPVVMVRAAAAGLDPVWSHPDAALSADDLQAADRALRHGAPQQATAAGWSGNRYGFYPLTGGEAPVVIGVRGAPDAPEREQAITSAIEQARATMERLRLAGEADDARHKADREAMRAALLSSLSHDLRTPLATILGSVTGLRQLGPALPASAREDLLAAIEEETRRLTHYVTNLLNMTRLQTGLDLRLDWTDPNDILAGAARRARQAFPAQTVTAEPLAEAPLIHTDAALLEQALFNLADNALRIAPAHRPLTLRIRRSGGSGLRYEVEDQGPGVGPADRTRIFDPFVRGDTAPGGGTGLGLAIARGIAQALSGTIGVDSPVRDGRGARFWIDLPAGETTP